MATKKSALPMNIVWFLGPRAASWNGVMKYSLDCLSMLQRFPDLSVRAVDIDAKPRSLKRYWMQFVVFPLRVMKAARSSDLIVLYQEDFAFLIPFARLAGARVCIITHHVAHPGPTRGWIETIKSRYIQFVQHLIAKASLVISATPTSVNEIIRFIGVKADRIALVANAFDARHAPTDSAIRSIAREVLNDKFNILSADKIILLNVGSDESRKNNITVFRALAQLNRKDVIFLRVGAPNNTTNRDECQALALRTGIIAHFIEGATDSDLASFYQASDLYVSSTLQEGFGRTVIEAQLMGVPVLASDIAVFRDTMKNSFSSVAELTAPAAWRAQIEKLIDDPELRADLAEKGRANARDYSTDVVAQQLRNALLRGAG
jgi:glycosyltransferase involved in cell wall biosynthesis